MKKVFFALLVSAFSLFSSCEEMELIPEINLMPIPDNPSAYLNISFMDSTYLLKDSVDNYYTAKSYITTAKEEIPYPSWSGVRFCNDSSIIDFGIYNIFKWMSRNELLSQITKSNQELAFYTYENEKLDIKNYGFLLEMAEYSYPKGGANRYASDQCKQFASSFFKITDYYAGETEHTIWLKGSFQVNIEYKKSIKTMTGEFFMEFPLWFKED